MKNLWRSVRFYLKNTDVILWLLTLAATGFSLLLIASMQRSGDYNYLKTQSAAVLIGFAAAVLISNCDYEFFINKWYFSAGLAAVLTALVFLFGIRIRGTDDTAWIEVLGYTVQPSEFVKICFIITFTKHISVLKGKGVFNKPWAVLSLLLHAGVPMALIHLQGDDGTVLIFGFIFLTMTFLSGVKLRYFAALGGAALASVPVIWSFVLNGEHRSRLLALFNIDEAVTGYGWQQYQGKLSIASGGLFGTGLFNGARVKYGIVPEQENDFILTVAGEELGFFGCILLIGLLMLIIVRIIATAKSSKNENGKLICSGVFALIASQTVINLGMVLGLFPVIGITLPLISSGGSSVMSVLICIGLVQSVFSKSKMA